MPAAVPAIAAAAASTAVTSAGFAIAGLSVATTAAIAGGAASILAGAAVSALTKPPSPDMSSALTTAGAGRATQVRQPLAPHQIAYGQVKVSGPMLLIHSQEDPDGRTFGDLFIVIPVCATHIKAIRTVYFGESLASDPKYEYAGGAQTLIRIGKHLGATDQAADADFVADIGDPTWGANHRLRGRAYMAARLRWDSQYVPKLENLSAIIDGVDTIYDPRTETTGFTNNAALCVANWITSSYGEGRAWSKIHEATLIEAANVCDERVLVLTSTTTFSVQDEGSPSAYGDLVLAVGARWLDWGDGVRVSSSGSLPTGLAAATTYYVIPKEDTVIDGVIRRRIALASTVANAFAGTEVALSSGGSGTLTLTYYDEARYKCNGTFTLDMEKGEVLDKLRASMAGYAFPRGGKWYIHAGAAALPTVTLTDDDLRAYPTITPKRSMRDRFNIVRGVFVNPDANWQPTDAPPRIDDDYIAEDADEELAQNLTTNFITSERQMQRVMKIELERNRQQGLAEVPCKLTAFKLAPLDGVYLTLDGYLTASQHRVIGWGLSPDLGVDITAQQDSADVYDWSTADELVGTDFQGLVLPDPELVNAPASVVVQTPVTPTYENVVATFSEVASIWMEYYDVEYREAGSGDWISYGSIGKDSQLRAQIERTEATDVRVRAVHRGAPSEFTTNLAPATPTSGSATGGEAQITLDADVDAGTTEIQIFTHDSNAFGSSSLLDTITPAELPYAHTGLGDGATHYYWLRAVNADGNISDETATLNATTDP